MKSRAHLSATLALAVVVAMALPGAAANAAGTPPAATTGAPSAITANAAVVSAAVQPNGAATSYYFEYGSSTQYGSQTPSTSLGSTSGSIPVQASLSGLTSGTTYHFRVVATSTSGTTFGGDATFTTSKSLPVVNTATAIAVSTHSATLEATVDAAGKATSYVFQYGPTASYGQQTATASAGSGATATPVHATFGSGEHRNDLSLQDSRDRCRRFHGERGCNIHDGRAAALVVCGSAVVRELNLRRRCSEDQSER